MQPTEKTTVPGHPPYILSGTNGTSGTALRGAGFSRIGERDTTGQSGTSKPQRAATGHRLLTRPPAWPLFSGAKVAPRQPLPANFSERQTGKKIVMIINIKRPPAPGFRREYVDNSPHFWGAVDNFLQHIRYAFAYLLSNSYKSLEGLSGKACGRLVAKVMHIGHYA